jgi:hypothetical protein
MPSRVREMGDLLLATAKEAISRPSMFLPAAVLLLPTLALQLAVPHLLRSRLSPSIWTVVIGGFALVWLTQVATVGACGLVDARRHGRNAPLAALARVALTGGSLVLLGWIAGGLPGLWLQARYAFAPLDMTGDAGAWDRLRASALRTRPAIAPLLALAAVSLLVSLLGQSLAAGAAEASGTIVATSIIDGRTTFSLSYVPHLLTSLLAYAFVVISAGLFGIGASVASERFEDRRAIARPLRVVGAPVAIRALLWTGGVTMVLGAAAAVYKVQQHL